MEQVILLIIVLIFALISLRKGMINSYKIGYYETMLKNRAVDISKIENMTFIDIWRS